MKYENLLVRIENKRTHKYLAGARRHLTYFPCDISVVNSLFTLIPSHHVNENMQNTHTKYTYLNQWPWLIDSWQKYLRVCLEICSTNRLNSTGTVTVDYQYSIYYLHDTQYHIKLTWRDCNHNTNHCTLSTWS